MSEDKIRQVSEFLFRFEELNLHGYIVLHGTENELSLNRVKRLFSLLEVEKILGFARQGWHWTRTAPKIRIRKQGYTDAETILKGLEVLQKGRKRKSYTNFETLKIWMDSIFSHEKSMDSGSLSDIRKIWPRRGVEEIRATMPMANSIDKKAQKEIEQTEGAVSVENEKNIKSENEKPLSKNFNFAFENAKAIVNYGEVAQEEIKLTFEINELKKKISDLQAELEIKQARSKQNRGLMAEWRLSLQNNPLIQIIDATEISSEPPNELKAKLERLENENKALKDRIGEGENFKTANMFPNKEKYFNTIVDPNGKIGGSLSMMARDKGIQINKVRSGSMEVGNYPVWLHEKLAEWLENKQLNKYTDHLQPFLKPEYRAQV